MCENSTSNQEQWPDLEARYVEEVIRLIPLVLEQFRITGKAETWLKFNRAIASKQFPLDNIAFQLFLNVAEWYSLNNTVTMRYDEQCKRFWKLGYKLFHGRFIRFMSGFKNMGQRGCNENALYNPAHSKKKFCCA